jgi:hypothetical protein
MNPNDQIFSNSTVPYSKRASVTITATALGDASVNLTELMIQAHPDNTDNVLLGSATDQSWVVQPGEIVNWPIRNPALIWGKSSSGTQYVNLAGRSGV